MPQPQRFPLVHTVTLKRSIWLTEENNGVYRSIKYPAGKHIPAEWVKKGYISIEFTTLQ